MKISEHEKRMRKEYPKEYSVWNAVTTKIVLCTSTMEGVGLRYVIRGDIPLLLL